MKLTYWLAPDVYALENPDEVDVPEHLRDVSRKGVKAQLDEYDEDGKEGFGKPVKLVLEYANGFDLFKQCADAMQPNGLFGWEDPNSSNEDDEEDED